MFALASAACGLAWNVLSLDVFRALQGIGGAMLFANAMPLIAQEYSGQRRNMAIAIWSSALGSSGALAPLFGGLVIKAGWRWMFLINVPIGVIAFILGRRVLAPVHGSRQETGIDWTGAMLIVAALGMLDYVLTRGPDQGWSSPVTLAQAGASVVLLVTFVLVERRTRAPMLDMALFAIPSFVGAAALSLLTRVIVNGSAVYIMIWLQQGLGKSPLTAPRIESHHASA